MLRSFSPSRRPLRFGRPFMTRLAMALTFVGALAGKASAVGEPAQDFLNQLRAAQYFDVAINYLDRISEFPGVEPEILNAIPLEKAQTYIDAAVATRNTKTRDGYFVEAEKALAEFVKLGSHPRISEARLQLGKLQMVRAAQLMTGDPDAAKRDEARASYLAAAKTFDDIVADLREKLKGMQGANIDKEKEPAKAALRDQYRGEFLQGKLNSAESRKLAARTFRKPAEEGKALLEQSLKDFTELSEKYDSFVQGALAMLYRGQVQQDLGMKDQALDSYIRMLETPDADPLRDGKFQATSGMIGLWLQESPPKFQSAIERGDGMIDDIRPNERRSASVQELRIALAQAYLLKSKQGENLKPAEVKRAESSGRQLLIAASKVPSEHMDEAKRLLTDLGVADQPVVTLPTAEDPTDLSDALEKASELLEASENLTQSLALLDQQEAGDELEKQKDEIKSSLAETQANAVQILRRGLAMVGPETDIETLNQARQFLAYMLYSQKRYRDAAVVGNFLAHYAPGTEMGLRGGVVALNSYQLLLGDVPDEENEGLIDQLELLGEFLTKTWPNDPKAAAAQGVRIRLALSKERWDEASKLIEAMPEGSERASYQRLMGQLLWNESIQAKQDGDDAGATKFLDDAQKYLQAGLDGIPTDLVDPDAARAALVLAKVCLKRGEIKQAITTIDHPKYGPAMLVEKQGAPDNKFLTDLYSTELQAVVQLMTTGEGDQQALLTRAGKVMDQLRKSVSGADSEKQLTGIYLRMAKEIREQLAAANEAERVKLTEAFRVFLERIADTSEDVATLQWAGQTLLELGEAGIPEGALKANGQSADLIQTAIKTFENVKAKSKDLPLTVDYQLARGYRLLGDYKKAIDALDGVLKQKPMMLDAQIEAAQAYESWAGIVPPKFAGRAYSSALNGGRPDKNNNNKNTIWGWGKISQLTSSKPQYRQMFFEARYHVALCRYKWGLAINDKRVKEQAISDITKVSALYPAMGGPALRTKFDRLLKQIQKDVGQPPKGLPPLKAAKPAA